MTALIADSAIISAPAVELEPEPLESASPFTVIVLPLRLVMIGVESVNWHVPDDGAVPSSTMEHRVAAVVSTKLLAVSKVPVPLNCAVPVKPLMVIMEPIDTVQEPHRN